MRQLGVLRINPGTDLIHTCPFRQDGSLEGSHSILIRDEFIVEHFLNMELTLRIGRGK